MANYGITEDVEQIFSGPARILIQHRYLDAASALYAPFFPQDIDDIIDLGSTTSPEPVQTDRYWIDLGATDGGTTIVVHNPAVTVEVDHQIIGYDRDRSDATISTTLAENSLDRIRLVVGEAQASELDGATNITQYTQGAGAAATYSEYTDINLSSNFPEFMIAVVTQKRNGRKRAYVFPTVQLEGGDISIPFVPGGGLTNMPVSFRGLRRTDLTPQVFRTVDETDSSYNA